jgi:hypothetical protein
MEKQPEIMMENLITSIQNNLGLIRDFIGEVKKCEDLDEQRYKIFQFMQHCFNESNISKNPQFRKLLRQTNSHLISSIRERQEKQPVTNIVENIAKFVSNLRIDNDKKKEYLEQLSKIDVKLLEEVSVAGITSLEMKYIVFFICKIDVKNISLFFNVEPESVHKMRYRIKKKLAKEDNFKMIL